MTRHRARNGLRAVMVLGLGLLSATATAAPPEADARQTAEVLFEVLKLGHGEAALAMTVEPQEPVYREHLAAEVQRVSQALAEHDATQEVVRVYVEGDWALVVTVIDMSRDDGRVERQVSPHLYWFDEGRWWAVPSFALLDPAVRPKVNADTQAVHDRYAADKAAIDKEHQP